MTQGHCDRCLSYSERIERNEMDIQKLDSSVSVIKNWIIAGCGAVIIQLGVLIISFVSK